MTVITRFAPSPTGFLHIGSARTALFNWLFARHHGGTFLLRIEDTDRARSTQAAIDAIICGMEWLGLKQDGEVIFQFARAHRHAEVANQLLKEGKAYYCYATQEELDAMREEAKKDGKVFRYDGRWRNRDPKEAPAGVKPVIRLKTPETGETVIEDHVQGRVVVGNNQLDDMVLLRSDGTPTYMLAVVVDDHDMGVTHVIRGDDHFTNAFRQTLLYQACGWDVPVFAHIPLIHGADGAKLSKRHGALGVEAYRDMGYLPEALCNYLLRLGWSHGDDEIISKQQAIEWFTLDTVGKSPARFDMAKLDSLNGHYIREADDERLVALILPLLTERLHAPITDEAKARLTRGMAGLKSRAKTLVELAENAFFYVAPLPLTLTEAAAKILTPEAKSLLTRLAPSFNALDTWTHTTIDASVRSFAEAEQCKMGTIAQTLRAAITGTTVSPGIFEVMEVCGKQETLLRLKTSIG